MTGASAQAGWPRNIFLIGYRGVGKTTVAKLVAEALGWQAVDADALLEIQAGLSIRQIFEQESEAGFRQRESGLLEEICRADRQVVATGGGIVLDPGNRALLSANGWSLWLKADPDIIERRLREDPITAERRPPLTVGGRDEIDHLLRVRQPLYEACAQASFEAGLHEPAAVAAAIVSWLRG